VLLALNRTSGDLQKVKLLRSVGIVWDAQTPAFAAAAGHLHIVQVIITVMILFSLLYGI
jgi:hypothetical protein